MGKQPRTNNIVIQNQSHIGKKVYFNSYHNVFKGLRMSGVAGPNLNYFGPEAEYNL